ncbi:MAG: hypothetical protein LBI96_03625, partial [Odoribacteraceae bacterium]|nr:hypothetical protein [Odoribacteraceae bacterium]
DGREVSSTWILDAEMGDIASVTLLKDAAATASFGASGGVGAVIITTVTPLEGKPAIAYDYSLAADLPYRAPWARNIAAHHHLLRFDGGTPTFRYGLSAFSRQTPGMERGTERNRAGGNLHLSYQAGDLLIENRLAILHADGKVENAEWRENRDYTETSDAIAVNWHPGKWSLDGSFRYSRQKGDGETRGDYSLSTNDPGDTIFITMSFLRSDYIATTKHANLTILRAVAAGDHSLDAALGADLKWAKARETTHTSGWMAGIYDEFTGKTSMKINSRSAFASLNYAYLQRYLLDVSASLEASSTFAATNARAWAIGAAWNIHGEPGMANSPFTVLRLRANIGNTARVSADDPWDWEKVRNTDVGADAALADGRLSLTANYYHKVAKTIFYVNTPSFPYATLYDVIDEGYELAAKWHATLGRRTTLAISGNLVHDKCSIGESYSLSSVAPAVPVDEQPKVEATLGAHLRYRRFTFQASCYARLGGHYNTTTSLISLLESGGSATRLAGSRWNPAGQDPVAATPSTSRVYTRHSNNFLELRSLHLAYDVPVPRISARSLRVAVIANDIFRTSSFDPAPGARSVTCSLGATF